MVKHESPEIVLLGKSNRNSSKAKQIGLKKKTNGCESKSKKWTQEEESKLESGLKEHDDQYGQIA
jgi:hypothetical protein